MSIVVHYCEATSKPLFGCERELMKFQTVPNLLWRVSPALLGFAVAFGFGAQTKAEVLSVNDLASYEAPASLDQVTSVSQLSDVQPTDWAFQALQSLVERYGCIAGYPDGTFRGNQALTRYEFAAGLNACLDQILAQVGGEGLDPGDLDTIRRLQDDFAAQLASLRGRVDSLESRIDTVEAQQFSTTTKLKGEVLFTIADSFGPAIGQTDGDPTQTTFSDRVRLNFESSFTGRDMLRTRLQAGNFDNFNNHLGTDEARLGHDADGGNDVTIDDLWYQGTLGDKTTFMVGTSGLDWDNVFNVVNPYFEGSGSGALSRFGRRNPAVYRAEEGAGVSLTHAFSDSFSVSAAYLADDGRASNSASSNGVFNGDYAAGAQIDFTPGDALHLALTYLHSYSADPNVVGSTGSDLAQDPFGSTTKTSGDHFGFQASAEISDGFAFGGWAGLVLANNVDNSEQDSTIFNWAANLAFPDLGGDGNLAGIIFGQTPHVIDGNNGALENQDATWHLEALYRIELTKGIDITPGVIWLINPEANNDNDDVVVVAVRTRFKF
jgi:Carbohydrate-selective porin, OprB family/S-layer homology domain